MVEGLGGHFGRPLGIFYGQNAIQNQVTFFGAFFIEFRCATGARRGREYGKNGELAPWSGALSFQKRDHITTLGSPWTASLLSLVWRPDFKVILHRI